MGCTISSCHPAACCGNGCFAHGFVLCFGVGCATGDDVCECTIPCFSYMRAPGIKHKQWLCFFKTQTRTPAPVVPVNQYCACNLCLCGFDFGNYRDTSKEIKEPSSTIVAPVTQTVSHD